MAATANETLAVLERKVESVKSFTTEIGDLMPVWSEKRDSSGMTVRLLDGIGHREELYHSTPRFLNSICSRFRIGPSIFTYFSPEEVFDRIQREHPKTSVRLTVDGEHALAVSNPTRPVVTPVGLLDILSERGDEVTGVELRQGMIVSTHRMQDEGWSVGADLFHQQYVLETPIDGYGLPNIYLSLLRVVCSNGMIGYSPAFRSEVQLGRGVDHPEVPLGRILDSFNNEEGFVALKERLDAAQRSYASVAEVMGLRKAITYSMRGRNPVEMMKVLDRLTKITGDVASLYGIASAESVSTKKQRLLPMKCSIYDLINAATELTTHYSAMLANPQRIHAWVGEVISHEYDLENSMEDEAEQIAFYLN